MTNSISLIRSTTLSKIICLLILLAFSIVVSANTSHAISPGNIYPPFDIGAQWNVCQGYDSGTHKNDTQYGSRISLDLTNSGCDSAAAGRVMRSPFNGTISWYVESSGSVCITSQDGTKSVMLTHIDSSATSGTPVTNYQVVGSIAAPGKRANGGVSHAHLQAWSSRQCQGNINQIPFDSAHGTRICGAPDLPENGPRGFGNGTWGSTRFVGDSCSTTIPPSSPSVFRMYSPITRHHLFTTDVNESNVLRSTGQWNDEGVGFWVKSKNGCSVNESVYRFYSEQLKVHLYTMDENEKTELMKYPPNMWRSEGTGFCASRAKDDTNKPVYRFYSDSLNSPHYTSSENEKTELMKYPPNLWRYEGIAYYAY